MIRDAIDGASAPPTPEDIGVYVLAVISEYWVGEKPQIVADIVNAIWIEHLSPFPAWAIKAAVSWWLGPDNPKRGNRPKPGDIAKRAAHEAAYLESAQNSVARWEKYRGAYPSFLAS